MLSNNTTNTILIISNILYYVSFIKNLWISKISLVLRGI